MSSAYTSFSSMLKRATKFATLIAGFVILPYEALAVPLEQMGGFKESLGPLIVGLILLLIVLFIEWHGIVSDAKLENQPISQIERTHPRLLTMREIVITILLSATIGIFLTELAMLLYVTQYTPAVPEVHEGTEPLIIPITKQP